ncbi:hypothetical protein CANARDRAFT_21877 [[Candida] arabinofermentans NRRL YB-2248]|uniref:Uncharacterized protein n=1 Tax=[Candida] arabinofermentans NRRL YB-2248 TaxID=983967 RepID=A0A1E4T567_9ASCO|nr:hypothetical protein CANARDRAFT_21877 [[Candida] arabinofermentans NRRL YB-2248]
MDDSLSEQRNDNGSIEDFVNIMVKLPIELKTTVSKVLFESFGCHENLSLLTESDHPLNEWTARIVWSVLMSCKEFMFALHCRGVNDDLYQIQKRYPYLKVKKVYWTSMALDLAETMWFLQHIDMSQTTLEIMSSSGKIKFGTLKFLDRFPIKHIHFDLTLSRYNDNFDEFVDDFQKSADDFCFTCEFLPHVYTKPFSLGIIYDYPTCPSFLSEFIETKEAYITNLSLSRLYYDEDDYDDVKELTCPPFVSRLSRLKYLCITSIATPSAPIVLENEWVSKIDIHLHYSCSPDFSSLPSQANITVYVTFDEDWGDEVIDEFKSKVIPPIEFEEISMSAIRGLHKYSDEMIAKAYEERS